MLCFRCGDTKQYRGNGMIMIDCNCEDLVEKTSPGEQSDNTKTKIDKRSAAYKTAIKEIMALNPSISVQEAAKMFEDEYDKG